MQFRRPGFVPWVRKIPWRRKAKSWSSLAWRIPCTEKLRSLVGYSPWCCKESETTEQTNTFTLSIWCISFSPLLNIIRKGILNFIKSFLASIEKIIFSLFPLPSYSYSEFAIINLLILNCVWNAYYDVVLTFCCVWFY